MKIETTTNRIFGLDIMRAMAIIFVLYQHGELYMQKYAGNVAYNVFKIDGVTIFFVLSGFLIGSILLKTINSTDFTHADLLNFGKDVGSEHYLLICWY